MTIKMEYDNVVQLLMQAKDLIMRQNEHTQSFIDGLRNIFPPETIAKFLIDLDKRRRILEDRIQEPPEQCWRDDFSTQKILNVNANYRSQMEQAPSTTSFLQQKSMLHTNCHATSPFTTHHSVGLGACTPNNQTNLLGNFLNENESFNLVDTQLERLFCDPANNLSASHATANSSSTTVPHIAMAAAHAPGNATPIMTPGLAAANMIVTGVPHHTPGGITPHNIGSGGGSGGAGGSGSLSAAVAAAASLGSAGSGGGGSCGGASGGAGASGAGGMMHHQGHAHAQN